METYEHSLVQSTLESDTANQQFKLGLGWQHGQNRDSYQPEQIQQPTSEWESEKSYPYEHLTNQLTLEWKTVYQQCKLDLERQHGQNRQSYHLEQEQQPTSEWDEYFQQFKLNLQWIQEKIRQRNQLQQNEQHQIQSLFAGNIACPPEPLPNNMLSNYGMHSIRSFLPDVIGNDLHYFRRF